jgi:hypothetical protein
MMSLHTVKLSPDRNATGGVKGNIIPAHLIKPHDINTYGIGEM